MGLYTRITRDWLEHRFRRHSPAGVYLAHMPIYGYGTTDAEGNQLGRLARVFRILRALDGLSFASFCDVGGAEGYLPHLVRSLFGASVATTDLSHEANQRARELFGLPSAAVDSARLPFRDGAFDVVVCSEVLEHVENPVETILELQRIARVALILTTEEIRYDRAAIDDYLFRRPGWPHMERNLFHPDDLAPCFPGATAMPQTDGPPPQEALDRAAARTWLLTHTAGTTMGPGHLGIVVEDVREPAARRARRHSDGELLDALLAVAIAPGSRWPQQPPANALQGALCDPFTRHPLTLVDDHLVGAAGRRYPVRHGVPDFVRVDDPAPTREELEQRLAAAPAARRDALLALRDRLFLPDRWSQDLFDLRQREHRRGFWPNQDLVARGGGEGFCWRSIGPDPWVLTPCLQRPIRSIEVEMRVHAPDIPVEAGTGQVFWKGEADESFEEARCVAWRVPNDGKVHTHRIVLEGHPRLPKEVQWLRLDLIDGACEVDFLSLRIH
jgi:SAM-dependent methyltransferase